VDVRRAAEVPLVACLLDGDLVGRTTSPVEDSFSMVTLPSGWTQPGIWRLYSFVSKPAMPQSASVSARMIACSSPGSMSETFGSRRSADCL